MKTLVRIISSLVLFPVLFGAVYLGGLPLKIGILFVSIVGMYEFYRAIYKKIMPIHYLGFLASIIYILSLDTKFFNISDVVVAILLIASMVFMVFNHNKVSISDVAITFFGVCYLPFMFSTVYLIRTLPEGIYMVWLPFICAWACDTGAYFTGISIGKHKLTPVLSPKKTVEGAIGGVVTSVFCCLLYAVFITRKNVNIENIFLNDNEKIFIFIIIGIVGAIFAQFGDLTASAIKRRFNVKDYGKLIPGHGGILDRFDSVIFTAGTTYIILKVVHIL